MKLPVLVEIFPYRGISSPCVNVSCKSYTEKVATRDKVEEISTEIKFSPLVLNIQLKKIYGAEITYGFAIVSAIWNPLFQTTFIVSQGKTSL
jgi:hypothetical protein